MNTIANSIEHGGIYLANMNPSKGHEPDKIRPVLVMQSNVLNQVEHPTIIILPLTSQLADNAFPLRFRIKQQQNLVQDSDVLCDQIRAIDSRRITSNKLAQLSTADLLQIERQLSYLLHFAH